MNTVQQEADRLYPPNQKVDDPEGETGEADTDPYGYDEACNAAFIQGAKWQAERQAEFMNRLSALTQGAPYSASIKFARVLELVEEWRLAQ